MEDSEHRALWGAMGVALLIAGIVVMSDWTFVAVAAPLSRDLTALWWPWVGALVLMALGVWALLGASIQRVWLPGKKALERRRDVRFQAELILGFFHNRGSQFSIRDSLELTDLSGWFSALDDFVSDAWGLHEASVLRPPGSVGEVREEAVKITGQVSRLIERCRILPLREEFDPFAEVKPDWRVYTETQMEKDAAEDAEQAP